MKRAALLAVLVAAFGGSGCALLTKNEPLEPRYFSPEPTPGAERHEDVSSDLSLRLGPVTAGSEIRQNLVVRETGHELSFSEERRWTEKPEAYLRRALSRELFEKRGVRRVVSGPSLTVEVELVSFEEVTLPTGSVGRAAATLILHDERVVREERTLAVDVPVERSSAPDHTEGTVRALAAALGNLVSNIADEVCRPGSAASTASTR